MKSQKNFYVAVGSNGGVLTHSYRQAATCLKYMRGHRFAKGFDDLEEAEAYLYDHLESIAPLDCPLPEAIPIGKVLTIRGLKGGQH
jgi:viroplasmin and RNaseH domain-containing protein